MRLPERNDKCWCGSNIKYKKCHILRENQKPELPIKVFHEKKKIMDKMKFCLHPEAPNNCNHIIKAHTIQRNGRLSSIADNGHVYLFRPGPAFYTRGDLSPQLTGIKQATTFTGFCNYHDTLLFKEIENEPIELSSKTAQLLNYRSICNELFQKQFQIKSIHIDKGMDKGLDEFEQKLIQETLNHYETGILAGIEDLNKTKQAYEKNMTDNDYTSVKYYAIIIDKKPDFMCSGSAQMILKDFSDKNILSIIDAANPNINFNGITLTIIDYEVDKGLVLLSWIDKHPYILNLITSLNTYPDIDVIHAVVRFAFEYYESIAISPTWWNKLSKDQQNTIMNRFYNSVKNRRHASLRDDGLRVVDWKVISRETNVTELMS